MPLPPLLFAARTVARRQIRLNFRPLTLPGRSLSKLPAVPTSPPRDDPAYRIFVYTAIMAAQPIVPFPVDRYVVIHVATTCDEHGVYVTKDSAEVIEIGWILLDAKTLDEVREEL